MHRELPGLREPPAEINEVVQLHRPMLGALGMGADALGARRGFAGPAGNFSLIFDAFGALLSQLRTLRGANWASNDVSLKME